LIQITMFRTTAICLLLWATVESFTPIQTQVRLSHSSSVLFAKKKNKKGGGKGFGKVEPTPSPVSTKQTDTGANGGDVPTPESIGFSSVEGASQSAFASRPKIDVDPNLPADQRTKEILKQQYGLRSFEEQQGDIKAAQRAAETRDRMAKIKQMSDDEFDIFMVIPPPIVKGIDAFLKIGLAVCTTLFVLSGVGITAEAWAVATGKALPENVDNFIVNVIEPNFTPGLLVLLGFSVSLGIFATAQLGSGSSVYKEEP